MMWPVWCFEMERFGDGSILGCLCQKANSGVRCLSLYIEAEDKKQASLGRGFNGLSRLSQII